ncbi:glucuronate isomerase [Candidatus Sumerlaeota bacterium]|nr:glucuronate isomerase [Candidatus Sumerlaeota bacterium]
MKNFDAAKDVRKAVRKIVDQTPIFDMHTHLFDPALGELLLAGIDELLHYHYCRSEMFRLRPDLPYEDYWSQTLQGKADLVWDALFVRNIPLTESARGVVTTLRRLGFKKNIRDIQAIRRFYAETSRAELVERIFGAANITHVVMTNDPFDDTERQAWESNPERDPRFVAALRIDPLLVEWEETWKKLQVLGCSGVNADLAFAATLEGVRNFLESWVERIQPLYMACSLPPSWRYPDSTPASILLRECVLPVCRKHNMPMALMIGVNRATNPELREAGDSLGRSDCDSLAALVREHPGNRFLCTMLSRENQHELTVLSRKFKNLMLFGCWWYMIVPSLMDEVTRLRLEMLGPGFIPQHSDCRVLEQLLYKWDHARQCIGGVLADQYAKVFEAGWRFNKEELRRDIEKMFNGALLSEFIHS